MVNSFHIEFVTGAATSLVVAGAMWGVTCIQTISYYRTFGRSDPQYLRIAVRPLVLIPVELSFTQSFYRSVLCGAKNFTDVLTLIGN